MLTDKENTSNIGEESFDEASPLKKTKASDDCSLTIESPRPEFEKKVFYEGFQYVFKSSHYSKKTDTWPPYISTCPDYWVFDSSINACVNTKKLGSGAPTTLDPNSSTDMYGNSAINTNCGKYNFATQYDLPWEGISYAYSVLPCNQPTTTTT